MWTQTPDDSRLGKLTLGLLTRERRWDEAQTTLETLRQKKPTDLPLLATLMRVQFQKHDWDAAARSLEEIRALAPESAEQWRTVDAFVKLMKGDRAGAIAAVAPLLEDLPASGRPLPPAQAVTVLGAPDGFDRLADYFERRRAQGDFTDDAGLLLTRIYQLTGKWDKAAAIALDEIWNNQSILAAGHSALDALAGTLAAAHAAKIDLAATAKRPEDRAVMLMLSEGPKAGADAFRKALSENPDNLNARRGLVLAAELADEWKAASEACDATIAWLAPRREELWRKATPRSLQRLAHTQMQSMKSSGVNTSMVLGMSAAVGQLFEQALDQDRNQGEDGRQPLKYETLWRAYQAYAPRLAMLAGNADGALAHLGRNAAQARSVGRNENGGGYRGMRRMYYPSGGMATYWDGDENRYRSQSEFERDSSKAMRRLLLETRQFSRLQAEFDKLGPHVPYSEWRALSQAYAAVGRTDDARRWRQKAADAELFDLRACDEAKLDTLSQWGWYYWYSGDNQDDQRLRYVLRTTVRLPSLIEMSFENTRSGDIASLAVDDERIRTEFRRLIVGLPDGFGESTVVSKLAAHYLAADDPRAIIDLFERTIGADGLLRSEHVFQYMQACLEAKDYNRAEKLVDAIAARSASLSDDVSLARLAILRLRGKSAEADALERELLAKCRVQPKLPSRVDERVLSGGFVDTLNLGSVERRIGRYRHAEFLETAAMRSQTISSMAAALGVQYDADVAEHDITRGRIADLYASHGLYEHAVRMNNEAIQAAADVLSPAERAEALFENAEWMARAGHMDEARKLAAELETGWLQAAQADLSDSGPLTRLLRLYTSKPIGPDHAKALDMSDRLRKICPNPTVSDPGEAESLLELKKPAEAWARYQQISARGATMTPGMLLRAGLSAARSGRNNEAAEFLRQGLWLSPRHPLATAAREIIRE
jgi:tetratricopeptide (TPR) repeat protein